MRLFPIVLLTKHSRDCGEESRLVMRENRSLWFLFFLLHSFYCFLCPFLHFSLPSKYVHPARIPTYHPIYWPGVENVLTSAFFNNSTKLIYFIKKQNKTQVLYFIYNAPKEKKSWASSECCYIKWWWWFSHYVMSDSYDPMDSCLPDSVHGILQARILEWVAISFSSYIK